jgi:glycosyltransferase involved in cell wall biosynthesis
VSKIVHFGKYFFPDTGGIESVTASLARGAARAGHQVTVVCFNKVQTEAIDVVEGVRVLRAPGGRQIASQPLGLRYARMCLNEARDADVVHLHAPNMLAALCCLFIPRKTRLLVHWHSDVINKGLLGRVLEPLERALLRRADRIVATSQVYADASETLKPFQQKVTIVPIGVPDVPGRDASASGLLAVPADLRARLGGKKLILAVGRLVPYKGFDVLIEATTHLPDDVLVVIVGGGPLHESLNAAIRNHNVAARVHLAGRLSNDALHALFARAAVYCLPSTYRAEAFGVVLLEAMAFGVPIVATDIPGSGVPWVNQHGVSGLNVPVGNAKALAEACVRILGSEHEHARLAAGARGRFMTEFTEEVSIEKMMATYEHMVSE